MPDYKVKEVSGKKKTKIVLERTGQMPMPIDLMVTYKNGDQEMYHIPMVIMRGEKPQENSDVNG